MKPRAAIVAFVLLVFSTPAWAEVRRALLVGINVYSPATDHREISDQAKLRLSAIRGTPSRRTLEPLDGAVNDAEAMKEMLVRRFGFDESNIIILSNQQATADSILRLLQSHLIDQAAAGDISLFYYAGHGSRITNLAAQHGNSPELDSTLIPADALLGVPDVRSKELARIYAQAPKKGVLLTVIQDSCYSGAASRGAVTAHKTRDQPIDPAVSVDERLSEPLPEDGGVLMIMASQDYEPAAELRNTDLDGPHGAFTWALLHALGTSSVNDRADRIFQRARALLQSKVPGQEPVLLAKKGRNARGLLGQASDSGQMVTVAAGRVIGSTIKLNGGIAMNLSEGYELKRVGGGKPPVEIRITKVNGLSSSDAIMIGQPDGDQAVQPGDLFAIKKWVAVDRALLRVYVGGAMPDSELQRALGALAAVRNLKSIAWVEDPTVQAPTHRLMWDPVKSKWALLEIATGSQPTWIPTPARKRLNNCLPREKKSKLFVQIPPSAEMLAAFRLESTSVAAADSPESADYVLLGRLCDSRGAGCVEYSWAVPDLAEDELPGAKFSARPLRTDWFTADVPAAVQAESLRNAVLGLAKVAGWLNLAPPTLDAAWPYELVLQNKKTKKILSTPEVRGDEEYQLMLRATPGTATASVSPRRVYVFVIDSFGKATLLFGQNLKNEFPRLGDADLIAIGDGDFTVSEPYGIDHYFLLATATPIDNPETVFNFSEVRTRGSQSADPLVRLLENTGAATRGAVTKIPPNWSITRLTVRSRPPASK